MRRFVLSASIVVALCAPAAARTLDYSDLREIMLANLRTGDATRIGVSGWSYGGYMTTWLIGHYHFWKTAVAGAPVTNLIDEYALGDNGVQWRYVFGGSPYVAKGMPKYRAQSPVTSAWNVTTPTLLLHDTRDARVPITQSYEFYRALKDRGTTVQFFAYPVAGHFPGDPVRGRDVYRRWSGWLEGYLK